MAQAPELKPTQPTDPAHYAESSARENLIEHVFLGELLRGLWRKNVRDLEVLRPEVDNGGYDRAGIQRADPPRAAQIELPGGTACGRDRKRRTAWAALRLHRLDLL